MNGWFDWDGQAVETLTTLWEEGQSASFIARALGGGVTRSAVIGKIHRLGLVRREGPARGPRPPRQPRSPIHDRVVELSPRQKQIQLRAQPEPEAARLDNGAPIGTADLTNRHCRWPHGDVGTPGFHYCGLVPKAGSSWCEVHAARAVQPVRMSPPPEAIQLGQQANRQFAKMWG